ncbi:MAG: thiopurine S-methyltransferase [Chromatiales bacterium]|jgi:thiopurine S-methyltransferase
MEKEFWVERWEKQQIGFHQAEINRYLQQYWSEISQQQNQRVFVPLCGKSLDMLWLKQQGHDVLGVEFSEMAVGDFFAENELEVHRHDRHPFSVWQSSGMELFCGDFFSLTAEDLADSHLVYDRAALVALPTLSRQQYAGHLARILPGEVRILLVTMEYPQHEMQGPPFSVSEAEVIELFAEHFHVQRLEVFDIYAENPRFQQKGLSSLVEKVFLLQRGK